MRTRARTTVVRAAGRHRHTSPAPPPPPPRPARARPQIPSTRDQLINAVNLQEDVKSQLEGHLTFAGIALAAVVGFQVAVLMMTWAQCNAVDPLNTALLDDDAPLAAGGASERARLKGGAAKPSSAAGRGGGPRESLAEQGEAGVTRYKSGKAAMMYEKYGVGSR